MFCSGCGAQAEDGNRFCNGCGAPLQISGGVMQRSPRLRQPSAPAARTPRQPRKSPYRDQIAQLRLQLKELRINLRTLNNQISGTRSNYFEIDSLFQRGLIHNVGRMIEGAQLLGPYQQRKQLQDQIVQLEHELLALERAQEQWRQQQGGPGGL